MKHFDRGFAITHHTLYEYSKPIFFEPHLLRFEIRKNRHIQSKFHAIDIQPAPAVSTAMIDAEDNHVLSVSFENKHSEMEIISSTEVLITDFNPFNFVIFPGKYLKIGFAYTQVEKAVLHAALAVIPVSHSLAEFNLTLLEECGYDTLQYLTLLTAAIHGEYKKVNRHDGPPLMPVASERAKQGSCRDLAYLQMALGRYTGLACRFVSGYVLDEAIEEDFELHAWMEVFLPGAGWVGFDPSTGLAVDGRYVPVACSAFPENTLPVSGNFRGNASSRLSTKITVDKLQTV